MTLTYKVMEKSLIPNTTMTEKINSETGVLISYDIEPDKGYVLHDNTLDEDTINPETLELTGKVKLGYYPIAVSCWNNYDFDNTTIIDGYTAYGKRELFARSVNEVPDSV